MLTERRLAILFGSQTGTAEDTACRLSRAAKRRHFITSVRALDEYNIADMVKEKLIIFVVATTGQGDPPDNMKNFWKFIMRRSLPLTSLRGVHFAVLALGDSSYQKFNFIGKKLHKRLAQLGGQPLQEIGLCDDMHDLGADAVIDPWSQTLWDQLMSLYPLPTELHVINDDVRPSSRYTVHYTNQNQRKNNCESSTTGTDPPSQSRPFHACMTSNDRVTAEDHWQDVRLIKLDISGSGISYDPGDVVMIQPENNQSDVEQFLTRFQLDPDQLCDITSNDPDIPLPPTWALPRPFTIHHLVSRYLDISSVPKRSFFEMLAFFTSSDMERDKFREFCTAEGQEELYNYCNRPRRTILEVLYDFPHVTLPLDYVFDIIPSLKPRAFSIASSLKAHPNEIHVLMAVVKYNTKLKAPRKGVCSTWLSELKPNSDVRIPVWVKKGTLSFPASPHTPVIMVGPGTGVAPFRSFTSHRAKLNIPGNYLYFGCRNHDKDYFFGREWSDLEQLGLLKIYTAFSRDQEEKIYVQDRMEEQAEELWDLLNHKHAYFLLAGNAKRMPDDVRAILSRVIQQQGGMSEDEAVQYISNMEKQRRYQAETWS